MSATQTRAWMPDCSAVVLMLASCLGVLGLASGSPAEAQVLERVVAVVNGQAIYLSQVRRRTTPHLRDALRQPTAAGQRSAIEQLYAHTLERMIDEQLIIESADESETRVPDADVERAIESVRRQSHLSRESFWREVLEVGFTAEEYREDVRIQLVRLRVLGRHRQPTLEGRWTEATRALVAELRRRAVIDIRLSTTSS